MSVTMTAAPAPPRAQPDASSSTGPLIAFPTMRQPSDESIDLNGGDDGGDEADYATPRPGSVARTAEADHRTRRSVPPPHHQHVVFPVYTVPLNDATPPHNQPPMTPPELGGGGGSSSSRTPSSIASLSSLTTQADATLTGQPTAHVQVRRSSGEEQGRVSPSPSKLSPTPAPRKLPVDATDLPPLRPVGHRSRRLSTADTPVSAGGPHRFPSSASSSALASSSSQVRPIRPQSLMQAVDDAFVSPTLPAAPPAHAGSSRRQKALSLFGFGSKKPSLAPIAPPQEGLHHRQLVSEADVELEVERRVRERLDDPSREDEARRRQMLHARELREHAQAAAGRSRYNSSAALASHRLSAKSSSITAAGGSERRVSDIDRQALIRSRKEISQPRSSSAISLAKNKASARLNRTKVSTPSFIEEEPVVEGILEPKVVLLGSPGVGKTSLARRYVKGDFGPTQTTIAQALYKRKTSHEGQEVRYQIWDTAGEERHRAITKIYYRGANAALIVYDITDERSFADVRVWLQDVQDLTEDPVIFVIGNKSDLHRVGRRAIERRVAREWVKRWLEGDRTEFRSDVVVPQTPPALSPVTATTPPAGRERALSLYRSKTVGASPFEVHGTSSALSSPATTPTLSEMTRPSPHRYMSLLSTTSPPSDFHDQPTAAIDLSPGSRAITGQRAQSVSATSTLMAFAVADLSRNASRMSSSKSASGLSNLLGSPTTTTQDTLPAPAARRKSEDWSLGRSREELAVAIADAGRPTKATTTEADEGWGRQIPGTPVRVGEISVKMDRGEDCGPL